MRLGDVPRADGPGFLAGRAREKVEFLASEDRDSRPVNLRVGPDGALYICEVANHRVRRLDLATGQISTVAGCGEKGYSGDGGPATDAALNEPEDVFVDASGHIFIADTQNKVIRRVDAASGIITTFAGTVLELDQATGKIHSAFKARATSGWALIFSAASV